MNEQLAAIRARRDAATPGVVPGPVYSQTKADATDKANWLLMQNELDAAPADIDTLLAHVAALTAERDALAQQLQQAQAQLANERAIMNMVPEYVRYLSAWRAGDGRFLVFNEWVAQRVEQAATTPSARKGEGMTIPALANYAPQAQVTVTLAELFEGREEWWLWYAIDADGRGHYFEKEPSTEGVSWVWDGGSVFGYKHDMTGVDWQTCIYCRPIEPTENDKKAFAMLERMVQEVGGIMYIRGHNG